MMSQRTAMVVSEIAAVPEAGRIMCAMVILNPVVSVVVPAVSAAMKEVNM
jgi:hypothetical protein